MDLWEAWEQHRGRGCVKLDSFPRAQHHHLGRFRGKTSRLLEIGVLAGGSLEIWQTYLGPDATIVGVDIAAAARQSAPDFTVHIGDQADAGFLQTIVAASGPFDIVIDDGGHTFDQQITSFEVLYPLLNEGGVYIVEDTCTSYWDEFDGGVGAPSSFIEYAKRKIDELNGDFIEDPAHGPTEFTRTTTAITFHQGMVAFEKHENDPIRYLLCQDGKLAHKKMRYGLGWVD
jgi:methyltransferase family protein